MINSKSEKKLITSNSKKTLNSNSSKKDYLKNYFKANFKIINANIKNIREDTRGIIKTAENMKKPNYLSNYNKEIDVGGEITKRPEASKLLRFYAKNSSKPIFISKLPNDTSTYIKGLNITDLSSKMSDKTFMQYKNLLIEKFQKENIKILEVYMSPALTEECKTERIETINKIEENRFSIIRKRNENCDKYRMINKVIKKY